MSKEVRDAVILRAVEDDPSVRLQVAIAARKIEGLDPIPPLVNVLSLAGNDVLTPPIVWQNLQPMLGDGVEAFLKASEGLDNVAKIYPRVIERLLAREPFDAKPIAVLLERLVMGRQHNLVLAADVVASVAGKVQNGEIAGAK